MIDWPLYNNWKQLWGRRTRLDYGSGITRKMLWGIIQKFIRVITRDKDRILAKIHLVTVMSRHSSVSMLQYRRRTMHVCITFCGAFCGLSQMCYEPILSLSCRVTSLALGQPCCCPNVTVANPTLRSRQMTVMMFRITGQSNVCDLWNLWLVIFIQMRI